MRFLPTIGPDPLQQAPSLWTLVCHGCGYIEHMQGLPPAAKEADASEIMKEMLNYRQAQMAQMAQQQQQIQSMRMPPDYYKAFANAGPLIGSPFGNTLTPGKIIKTKTP